MSRRLIRIAIIIAALALATTAVSACGSGPATTSGAKAADFAGLWVNPEFNNEIWLHATASGDAVALRWEREWDPPVMQQATVQNDGTLKAPGVPVPADPAANGGGEAAYTGRLTADGGLDMATTTHVTGVDAAIPVTIHFVRGSQAKYAVFAARMNKNLKEQRIGDAFSQALATIGKGIGAWQDARGLIKAPPVSAVRPGGAVDKALQANGKTWPRLSDGRLLQPGTGLGEYVYRPLRHGYRVSGRAEDGQGPMSTSTTW